MVEPIPLFPAHRSVDPARFAASQHVLFAGKNLRIGASDVVHGVVWREWLNGLTLPTPACGQGWSGLGAAGEVKPTGWPATCEKCRPRRGQLASPDEPPPPWVLFAVPD